MVSEVEAGGEQPIPEADGEPAAPSPIAPPPGDKSLPAEGGEAVHGSPTVPVRFGQMGFVGEFICDPKLQLSGVTRVVIQTKRGMEIGERVTSGCHGCSGPVGREQMMRFAEASGQDYYLPDCGRILREATAEDLAEYNHILDGARAKRQTCQEFAAACGLNMKVVSCEPLFGGERIVLYFVAEGRIDFRVLVKNLAQEFQTRIEMRQVGARDEARLVADYETCGRECCCKNFLKSLKPVSMKMAKMQKATLDPSKVSGRCGRLKCCLRFENATYEDLDALLPRLGARVRTRHGEGTVVARQIMTQLVQVETEAGGRMTVAVEDLLKAGEEAPAGAPEAGSSRGPAEAVSQNTAPRRERGRWEHRGPTKEAPSEAVAPVDESASPKGPAENVAPAGAEDGAAPPEGASGNRRRRRRNWVRPRGRRGRAKGGDGPIEPQTGTSGGPSDSG